MDTNLHADKLMEGQKPPDCTSEDRLLIALAETVQELEGVQCCGDHLDTAMGGRMEEGEDEREDERRRRSRRETAKRELWEC